MFIKSSTFNYETSLILIDSIIVINHRQYYIILIQDCKKRKLIGLVWRIRDTNQSGPLIISKTIRKFLNILKACRNCRKKTIETAEFQKCLLSGRLGLKLKIFLNEMRNRKYFK